MTGSCLFETFKVGMNKIKLTVNYKFICLVGSLRLSNI